MTDTQIPSLSDLPLFQDDPEPLQAALTTAPPLPTTAWPTADLQKVNAPQHAGPTPQLNRALVAELLALCAREIQEATGADATEDQRRQIAMQAVTRRVQLRNEQLKLDARDDQSPLTAAEQVEVIAEIMNSMFGLGRIQPLTDDDTIENIEIIGCDRVYVERADGSINRVNPVADTDEELLNLLASEARRVGKSFDPTSPTVHLTTREGHRMAAGGYDLCDRPIITIRRHRVIDATWATQIARGVCSPAVANFISAAAIQGQTILIVGAQGSGKTLALQSTIAALPPMTRFATLETEYELPFRLQPDRYPRAIAWQAREGGERRADGTRAGEYTLNMLISDSVRHNLARLVVGELRDREVVAFFKAMQATNGALATIHGHSAMGGIDRLVTLAMDNTGASSEFAYRQIAANIDIVVHISLEHVYDSAGELVRRDRYIDEVIAINPSRDSFNYLGVNVIFGPGDDGHAIPNALPADLAKKLRRHGLDTSPWGVSA